MGASKRDVTFWLGVLTAEEDERKALASQQALDRILSMGG